MGDSRRVGGSGRRTGRQRQFVPLTRAAKLNSEEAGRAGGRLYAQSWEHWWRTRYIPPLCCKDYAASSEQHDAPFAGTLLSSTSLLPAHSRACLWQGKMPKCSCFRPANCCPRAQVLPAAVSSRAAGSAQCAGQRWGCRMHRLWEGAGTYRDPGNYKLLCFHSCSDEVLGQVVCKHSSWFHSWLKTRDA